MGGPIRDRVPGLLIFTAAGAAIWSCFGMLRPLGIRVVVPLACVVIFCNAYARVYGLAAAAIGNVLTVVLVFALDVPLSPHKAGLIAAMFVAGGLWCTLLTLVIWRLYPARHARLAVAEAWQMLAELALDLHALARREGVALADWEAHARAHRRAVRDAIERARVRVVELARGGGQVGPRAAQASVRLETADQLFGALIALSELLEHAPGLRAGADGCWRRWSRCSCRWPTTSCTSATSAAAAWTPPSRASWRRGRASRRCAASPTRSATGCASCWPCPGRRAGSGPAARWAARPPCRCARASSARSATT